MHVVHTAGVPPSSGSSIFAIIGWSEKRSAERTKMVTPKRRVYRVFMRGLVRRKQGKITIGKRDVKCQTKCKFCRIGRGLRRLFTDYRGSEADLYHSVKSVAN